MIDAYSSSSSKTTTSNNNGGRHHQLGSNALRLARRRLLRYLLPPRCSVLRYARDDLIEADNNKPRQRRRRPTRLAHWLIASRSD
ncbi:hypothetical protein TKK_0006874 [Trichogramma kaykai]